MKSRPDKEHTHAVYVKGAGRVYVNGPTLRVLTFGFVGSLVAGLPLGAYLSTIVTKDPWIGFVAGYGGAGIIGWAAGMILALSTGKRA